MIRALLFLFAISAALTGAAPAQTPPVVQPPPRFPYERFEAATVADLAKAQAIAGKAVAGEAATVVTTPEPMRAKLVVLYTGESRPLAGERQRYVGDFLAGVSQNEGLTRLFRQEYRFTENGRAVWLAVKTDLPAFFQEELKPGQPVELYVLMIGGVGAREAPEPVGLVEEFQAITPAT